MKQLPIAARIYVGGVIAGGALLLAAFFPTHDFLHPQWFVTLLLLSSITSAFKVNLPLARSGSTMSVSYAVDFLSLILLGPAQTMIVGALSAWSQCTFRMTTKNPPYRTFFSMSSLVISVQAAGWAFQALGGIPGLASMSLGAMAKPLLGAAGAYFFCNTILIASAIALSTHQSLFKVWNENFLWSAPSYFVGAVAAAGVSIVIGGTTNYYIALLAAPPLYLTYRSYKIYLGRIEDEQRHVQEVSDLHLATIEALALAIDAKDRTGKSHIRRVQVFAAGLAKSIGMSENEIQGVKTAALLHDIGKLAVPEHILSKPGPLTQEEFQKIRIHPQVGAEIIAGVPFPYPVAPLILSHHERWDGKGYPAGMKGDEIPAGARILAVVDYFDALTSERPYHKAMSDEGAVGLLRQEAGKALDPNLVQIFVENLDKLRAEAETTTDSVRTLALPTGTSEKGRPAVGLLPEPSNKTVFDDIALAHREIYALYEIAQAMGTSLGVADTMALISSKLSNLVPFSCCALFLYNEELETLRCRFATGIDAEVIQQISVKSGLGLTGWVARNRRTLVNARPSADLEAAGIPGTTSLQSALVCPLVFNERFIGTLSVYHIDAGLLYRRPSPAARSRLRAGRGGHLQLDRLRADPGRFADRSADRAAEYPVHVHAPDARARARRAVEVGSLAARHGPRPLQGNQRQPRPSRRRPRAARSGGRPSRRDPAVRHLRPLRRRRVHRRAVGLRRRRSRAEAHGAADRHRRGRVRGAPGQAPAARHQHRRGDLPARRQYLRDAAGHGRQPDVSRQAEAQAHARRQAGDGTADAVTARAGATDYRFRASAGGVRRSLIA